MGLELDKWIEKVRRTEYLAEDELKALCDYVGGMSLGRATTAAVGHLCPSLAPVHSPAKPGSCCRR